MTLKEIGQQLHTFNASRHQDPASDTLIARVTDLESQLASATRKQDEARQADENAHLFAETTLGKGGKVDHGELRRLRSAVGEAEHATRLVGNALESVRRDIAKVTAARAERDIATLTPIFAALVALYEDRALALVEVQDLLEVAHETANAVLPGASSVLQHGFAGSLTRERLALWRERAVGSGLLSSKGQRVA